MKPQIRQFKPTDTAQVVELLAKVLPDNQPHNDPATSIASKLAIDDAMYVADIDSVAAGFVMTGYDGHRGWIYQLAVLPEYRRHGIGSQLIETALAHLETVGCRKVNLQIRADNTDVVDFYESIGFRQENRISMGLLINK
jgi:ribosomal protein S18 acetylase RimI-like enzyme